MNIDLSVELESKIQKYAEDHNLAFDDAFEELVRIGLNILAPVENGALPTIGAISNEPDLSTFSEAMKS